VTADHTNALAGTGKGKTVTLNIAEELPIVAAIDALPGATPCTDADCGPVGSTLATPESLVVQTTALLLNGEPSADFTSAAIGSVPDW